MKTALPEKTLDDACVLYEGSDFEEWKGRIRRLLRVNGCMWGGIDNDPSPWLIAVAAEDEDEDEETEEEVLEGYLAECEEELQLIRYHVHPQLMARTSHDMTPFALMALLKKLATPFDFMRLPEELRLQVYRIVFQGQRNWVLTKFTPYSFPALLSASSQIRRAALPIYYEQADFSVFLRSLEDAQKVKKWAAGIAGPSLRCLKGMRVGLPWKHRRKPCGHFEYTCRADYELEWSAAQGLRITNPPKVDKSTMRALEDKIKTTNAYAKAADCGGEAIILAISAMMTTWIPLHFRPLCKCK